MHLKRMERQRIEGGGKRTTKPKHVVMTDKELFSRMNLKVHRIQVPKG